VISAKMALLQRSEENEGLNQEDVYMENFPGDKKRTYNDYCIGKNACQSGVIHTVIQFYNLYYTGLHRKTASFSFTAFWKHCNQQLLCGNLILSKYNTE
jgi:hypothetical protein